MKYKFHFLVGEGNLVGKAIVQGFFDVRIGESDGRHPSPNKEHDHIHEKYCLEESLPCRG